jgi:YihY family inner membrane protein
VKVLERIDRFQRSHRSLAIPVAVAKKFSNDQGGNLAALVAYYAFFSLFPLLLVFVTVLGYVLHGNQSAIDSVRHTVARNFPGIEHLLDIQSLSGSGVALAIGLLTALWAGLGVTNSAQNAFAAIWAVPMKARPSFIASRLRGLALIFVIGTLFLLATAASGLVSAGLAGPAGTVAGIVLSLLVNLALFFVAFRLMTTRAVATRCLWNGVVLAAIVWTVLQAVGGLYVRHVIAGLSPAYSSFATVIPLLIWLHLGAQMTLYAAELNTVLARKLWPRSLVGPPTEPADRATIAALARVEERDDSVTVEVAFAPHAKEPDGGGGDA